MEEIGLSQTQTPSSAGSTKGHESSDDSISAPAAIDERVITGLVLGVRRGHRKGVGRIIKSRRKASDTPSLSVVTGLSEQSAQATEDIVYCVSKYTLSNELEALKAFIT